LSFRSKVKEFPALLAAFTVKKKKGYKGLSAYKNNSASYEVTQLILGLTTCKEHFNEEKA